MRNILSFNQILDTTYDLYRKYLKSFIGYTTLTLMVSSAIMYGIMIVVGIVFAIVAAIIIAITGFEGEGFLWLILIYVGIILLMLPASSVMQLVAAGPIHAVAEDRKGNKVTFGQMFSYSFKNIWYVITSTLAYIIVFTVIVAIGIAISYFLYVTTLSGAPFWLQIVFGIVLGLLVLAACIWFGIYGVLYLPVALWERKHFFGAIKGSFKLVQGQFKRIFAIVFSCALSYFMIYLCLGGLFSSISSILTTYFTERSSAGMLIGILLLQMLLFLVQMAVTIVITPLQYITTPILYFNERNRIFGDDLHKRINELLQKQKEALQ